MRGYLEGNLFSTLTVLLLLCPRPPVLSSINSTRKKKIKKIRKIRTCLRAVDGDGLSGVMGRTTSS